MVLDLTFSDFNCKVCIYFRPKARTAASIILRGPNDFYCDEMERSVHDALCVVKRVLESKSVVVGMFIKTTTLLT